jgi:4-hydroxythreonine-4-phosphate dehydrogenase
MNAAHDTRPPAPLLITMGDASGIGPEVIAKAFANGQAQGCAVVGSIEVMRRALRWVGAPAGGFAPVVAKIEQPQDVAALPPGLLPVLEPSGLDADLAQREVGRVDAVAARASVQCIEAAVAWALQGRALALVTAPIHKQAWHEAGVTYPGHTEMLQHLAAQGGELPPVRMMLANDELKTVLVTIHVALREAIGLVTRENVLQTVRLAHRALQRPGEPLPRIAVAGLNPHAGEGGLFGDEELLHIAPAVADARAEGLDVQGPLAPDTVFMRARHAPGHAGEFDVVVAMTHDHGLIPVKYLGVEQGVNVTLGLPFVRTSPDHGTAFDLAGSGRADPRSLQAALRCARELAGAQPLQARV